MNNYQLNNFNEAIFFIQLEEKHFSKLIEFFNNLDDKRIKNVNIELQAKSDKIKELCKKYNIKFNFDVYSKTVQLNLNIDYNISSFDLDLEEIEDEEDLVEQTVDQRNEILGEIENNLINYIGYDEYNYIEMD